MADSVVSTRPQQHASITIDHAGVRRDMAVRRVGKIGLILEPIFGYFFLWAPILLLVIFSFNNGRSVAQWQGFTTEWYQHIFNDVLGQEARFSTGLMLNSLGNSLVIATTATNT